MPQRPTMQILPTLKSQLIKYLLLLIATLLFTGFIQMVTATQASAAANFTGTYKAHNDETWWGETCNLDMPIIGAEPEVDGKYPVLVWDTGTSAEGDWTGWPATLTKPYDQALAKAVVKKAADNGFVAVFGQYRGRWSLNNNNGMEMQNRCMLSRTAQPTSILDVVCARPKADCSKIVMGGHSQGGVLAYRAKNTEPNIKAVYSTGVFCTANTPTYHMSTENGGTRALANADLRIATGREDTDSWLTWFSGCAQGDYTSLRQLTGLTCANGTIQCSRPDLSGWRIVQHTTPPNGPTDGFADHCFMSINTNVCKEPQAVDPFWLDGGANGQGTYWTFGGTDGALAWLSSRVK